MRRTIKWVALVLVTLPIHLVLLLAFMGVPRPPWITAVGVGRVGWRPVLDNAGQLWRSRQSKSLVAWMPDGSGLLVQGRRMILDTRLHTLSDAAGEPVFLPQIPRNVGAIHGHPGREHMVWLGALASPSSEAASHSIAPPLSASSSGSASDCAPEIVTGWLSASNCAVVSKVAFFPLVVPSSFYMGRACANISRFPHTSFDCRGGLISNGFSDPVSGGFSARAGDVAGNARTHGR